MNELFDVKEKVIVVTGATGILAGGAAKYLQKMVPQLFTLAEIRSEWIMH